MYLTHPFDFFTLLILQKFEVLNVMSRLNEQCMETNYDWQNLS